MKTFQSEDKKNQDGVVSKKSKKERRNKRKFDSTNKAFKQSEGNNTNDYNNTSNLHKTVFNNTGDISLTELNINNNISGSINKEEPINICQLNEADKKMLQDKDIPLKENQKEYKVTAINNITIDNNKFDANSINSNVPNGFKVNIDDFAKTEASEKIGTACINNIGIKTGINKDGKGEKLSPINNSRKKGLVINKTPNTYHMNNNISDQQKPKLEKEKQIQFENDSVCDDIKIKLHEQKQTSNKDQSLLYYTNISTDLLKQQEKKTFHINKISLTKEKINVSLLQYVKRKEEPKMEIKETKIDEKTIKYKERQSLLENYKKNVLTAKFQSVADIRYLEEEKVEKKKGFFMNLLFKVFRRNE